MERKMDDLMLKYEVYASRAPYLPQIALVAILVPLTFYLSLMSGLTFLELGVIVRSSGGAYSTIRHGFIGVIPNMMDPGAGPFFSMFMTLLGNLAGLLLSGAALMLLPVLHEFNRPVSGFQKIGSGICRIIMTVFIFVFSIWTAVAGVLLAGFGFVPMLFTIHLIPLLLAIVAVHVFIVLKVGKAVLSR